MISNLLLNFLTSAAIWTCSFIVFCKIYSLYILLFETLALDTDMSLISFGFSKPPYQVISQYSFKCYMYLPYPKVHILQIYCSTRIFKNYTKYKFRISQKWLISQNILPYPGFSKKFKSVCICGFIYVTGQLIEQFCPCVWKTCTLWYGLLRNLLIMIGFTS